MRGGFHPDQVYEVQYRTSRCPLVGAGLAVVRDVTSHLLASHDHLVHAFAVGWSQSGRFLRQYLRDGFNCDEAGNQVFDAVMPFVAGSSTGEFNRRYGQPSEALAEGSSLQAPFAMAELLATERRRGTAPKVVSVNTASEYWRGDASLGHVTMRGGEALDDEDVREFYLAGTEHIGGAAPSSYAGNPIRNHLSVAPLYRALLELARQWVVDGVAPPQSCLPRRRDGTAVSRRQALDQFAEITGLATPDEDDMLPGPSPLANSRRGAGDFSEPGFVCALDSDANELAGIRHPELCVPLATHTGWNLLLVEGPQWAAVGSITGNSLPFPADTRHTDKATDRRRSIAERYRDVDDYLSQLERAAQWLMTKRFFLPEDVDRVVATARLHYELILNSAAQRAGA